MTREPATQELVREAAARAAARFPWYARLLQTTGEPPILHEEDLATTYYATDVKAAADEIEYLTSGTAAGVRKRVRWTRFDHERYIGHRVALFRSFLGDARPMAAADLGTGHAAASAAEIFAALGLVGREIDVDWPLERHLECLADWRPGLLFTMPMILEQIVAAGGPGYVPEWVVVLGDLAAPAWRAAMEGRLGIAAGHIVDVFGSIEVGAIAYSDDTASCYLFHEHIVPELGDDERLIVTSLERDGFPAVRYESGDRISGLRQVTVDGRARWAYDQHLGRVGSEIKHGEMLSVHAMADAIGTVAPGVAWAVRREGHGVVIELDERGYSPEVADAVRRAVRRAHPAVDRMIGSGLVGDIGVEPRAFAATDTKRSFR